MFIIIEYTHNAVNKFGVALEYQISEVALRANLVLALHEFAHVHLETIAQWLQFVRDQSSTPGERYGLTLFDTYIFISDYYLLF